MDQPGLLGAPAVAESVLNPVSVTIFFSKTYAAHTPRPSIDEVASESLFKHREQPHHHAGGQVAVRTFQSLMVLSLVDSSIRDPLELRHHLTCRQPVRESDTCGLRMLSAQRTVGY